MLFKHFHYGEASPNLPRRHLTFKNSSDNVWRSEMKQFLVNNVMECIYVTEINTILPWFVLPLHTCTQIKMCSVFIGRALKHLEKYLANWHTKFPVCALYLEQCSSLRTFKQFAYLLPEDRFRLTTVPSLLPVITTSALGKRALLKTETRSQH